MVLALTQEQIRRGSFRSVRVLIKKINQYLEHHNQNPKPFAWTKSADEIFAAIYATCKDVSVSPH